MSGARAQIIDEMDLEDDDVLDQRQHVQPADDLPPGIVNTNREQLHRQRAADDQEPAYQIVETDEDGNEIGHGGHQEQSLAENDSTGRDQVNQDGRRPARPHQSRSERTRRQRERMASIEAENIELRDRLDAFQQTMGSIEPRISEIDQARRGSELREMTRQIEMHQAAALMARQRIKEAFSNQDPDAFDAATDARDAALRAADSLEAQRRTAEAAFTAVRQSPQAQQQPNTRGARPAPLPPDVADRVEDFVSANPWYKPHDPRDIDSDIILQIDRQVAAEGFDPRSSDYWDEIGARAARYLPHRFGNQQPDNQRQASQNMPRQQQQQPAPQRRGPMVGGGTGQQPAQSDNRVMLTPARKASLIEIGVLAPDGRTVVDQNRFTRVLKGYSAFDRENRTA